MSELIASYTRAEALADGALIDVSGLAYEAGIRFPTAITAAAHADCVAWTCDDGLAHEQREHWRLWNVVYMLAWAMRQLKAAGEGNTDRLVFAVHRVPNDGRGHKPELARLRAVIDGGDDGSPVITIMLATES